MGENKNKLDESGVSTITQSAVDSAVQQEVEGIKQAVDEVCETCLDEKVDALRTNIDNITEDVEGWKIPEKDTYLEAFETLKGQVSEIESEWGNVSATMKTQRERLESLLESFPGVIETSSIRALALRITYLEKLVSSIVKESESKATASGTRRQLIISIVALSITVVLWGAWLGLNFFG